MPQQRSSTLADVARQAGVSIATASKALNGRERVSAETRSRVEAAARELAFTHNPLARGLSQRRSGTVGLLTSDLEGRFSLPVLMGAEDRFAAGRLSVFLCDARGDSVREQHHVAALLGRRVDGLLVVGSRTDPRPPLDPTPPVPVVYVYTPSSDENDISFTPDNVQAGHLAVEHLVAVGRRRIAHLTGPRQAAAMDRGAGIRAALDDAGLSLAYETAYGEWSERWGRSAVGMMLDGGAEVDAIVCDSDQIARGALDSLKEHGRRIPDDVAVLGFDNWEIVVEGTHPRLTSVDMQLRRLGSLAAERLFAAIGGTVSGGVERLPCELVARGSTTPEI